MHHATTRAGDTELMLATLAKESEAMFEADGVIPMTCTGCGRRFEVHCARPTMFWVIRTCVFDCPGVECGRRHERALEGAIVRVVAIG